MDGVLVVLADGLVHSGQVLALPSLPRRQEYCV